MPLSQMLTINALLSSTYSQIGEAWKSADELVFATCQEVYGGGIAHWRTVCVTARRRGLPVG